jgi:hypothetical protein
MPPYLYKRFRISSGFVRNDNRDRGIAKTTINLTLLTVGLKSDLVNKILRFPFILLLLIATKCHFDGINIRI